MKILTAPIIKAFAKQGYTGNMETTDIKVVLKMFNPTGGQTWYLYEQIGEDTYMAFVNLGDAQMAECGQVSMRDLLSLRGLMNLPMERDRSFTPLSRSLQSVIDAVKNGGHV